MEHPNVATHRRVFTTGVALAALLLWFITPARAQQIGCVPAVRDEFLREQSIVQWTVYCPTFLPGEFQIERVDGGMNPGGGLFTVTLTSSSGAELIITQGAGASIFARHTAAGPPERPTADAQFGDLSGKLYAAEPPGVTAFDSDHKGHGVQGTGIGVKTLTEIAAAMKPVALVALPDTGTDQSADRSRFLPVFLLALTGAALMVTGALLELRRSR